MHNTIAAAPISAASDEVRLKSICHHLHLVMSNPNVGRGELGALNNTIIVRTLLGCYIIIGNVSSRVNFLIHRWDIIW